MGIFDWKCFIGKKYFVGRKYFGQMSDEEHVLGVLGFGSSYWTSDFTDISKSRVSWSSSKHTFLSAIWGIGKFFFI